MRGMSWQTNPDDKNLGKDSGLPKNGVTIANGKKLRKGKLIFTTEVIFI
jgi:hypothetical protein